jgi:hypothetical protein
LMSLFSMASYIAYFGHLVTVTEWQASKLGQLSPFIFIPCICIVILVLLGHPPMSKPNSEPKKM